MVIVFAEKPLVQLLMNAINPKSVTPTLIWIFADSVGLSRRQLLKYGNVIGGGLLIRPKYHEIPKFDNYFKDLLLNPGNTPNQWLREFLSRNSELDEVCVITCRISNQQILKLILRPYQLTAS